jgi:U3 small nucleolar RNA-associated protein 7
LAERFFSAASRQLAIAALELTTNTMCVCVCHTGVDRQVKVWDVRTFKPLHAYFANSPATSLDISQRGILAVGQGRRLQLWRDCLSSKAAAPYLTHMLPLGGVSSLRFCPYEDVLGVGTAGGVSSVLVPGAGEPNFDSFVANPYANTKERKEQEVAQLLDKLQPDTIMLDPEAVGKVRLRFWMGFLGFCGVSCGAAVGIWMADVGIVRFGSNQGEKGSSK